MSAFARNTLRTVVARLLVVAMVGALLTGFSSRHMVQPPKSFSYDVIETASIVQLPTTIGSADSDLYNRTQADVDRTLDTLQAMGVQNVRIIVPWAGVQPLDLPSYNWANVDRMVDAAAARNMGVLAVINSTPRWAGRPYLSGHPTPEAFAEFAGRVADRYAGKIAAYEVWNEPNALTFWNPVDPEAYTRMLQAGYTAIKDEDPDALVVGGVVASLFSTGSLTINPQDFVAAMYQHGGKGYFDAISFHPYHFTLPFSESGTQRAGALNQLKQMRQVMIDNGDGNLKIWASEYGVPTAQISTGEVISETQQAALIEDFLRTWSTQDGTGPIFIYSTRDTLSGDPDIQKNFGFFFTDWTPKEAAYVIARFAGGQVGTAPPGRPILDAVIAIARAIVDTAVGIGRTLVDATVRAITAGVQLFIAAVDVTVQVSKGLIDLGVQVVTGLANATIAVIDAIRDRVGPDEPATADATQRVLRSATASSDESANDSAVALAGEAPEAGGSRESDAGAISDAGATSDEDTASVEDTASDVDTDGGESADDTTEAAAPETDNAELTGTEDENTATENETDDTTDIGDTAGAEDTSAAAESDASTPTQSTDDDSATTGTPSTVAN